jgi:hypothetical protein
MDDFDNEPGGDVIEQGAAQGDPWEGMREPPRPSFTQQAVQPLFPQWTTTDDMKYARTAAEMAKVRTDLDEGNLHPEYAQQAMNPLQSTLNELQMRKQAADAFKMHSATQAALGQSAMQQAVQIQNQQHAAAAFPSTMQEHLDPVTGEVTRFYQHEPGKWKQVERPRRSQQESIAGPNDPYAGASASANLDYMPIGAGLAIGANPSGVESDGQAMSPNPDAGPSSGADPNQLVGPPATDPNQFVGPPSDFPDGAEQSGGEAGATEGARQGIGEGGRQILGPDGQPLTDQPRWRIVTGADGVPRQQRIPTLAERQAMDAATPQQQTVIAGQIARGTFGQGGGPGQFGGGQSQGGGPLTAQNGPYTDQYQDGRLTSTDRPQQGGNADGANFSAEEIQHSRNVAAAMTAGMAPGLHRDIAFQKAAQQVLLGTAHRKEADRRAALVSKQQQEKAAAGEKSKATAVLEAERKESRTSAWKAVDEDFRAHATALAKDANHVIPPNLATPEARLAEAQRIHRESWAAAHPDSQEAKNIASGKAQAEATAPSEMDKISALGQAAEAHYNAPGSQGFFYNTGDANTAKKIVDVLGPAFTGNRPLTQAERTQYDALQKTIADPQLRDRLDWNGKFAQQAKGLGSTVQRGTSGAPVYRDAKVAAQVNDRLKELGLGERTKPESAKLAVQRANEEEVRSHQHSPERFK